MLLNILQCTEQTPPQGMCQTQMSTVPRTINPAVFINKHLLSIYCVPGTFLDATGDPVLKYLDMTLISVFAVEKGRCGY